MKEENSRSYKEEEPSTITDLEELAETLEPELEECQTFKNQLKKLFSKETKTSSLFLDNISSSLSLCLISFPLALSIALSLNDRLPKDLPKGEKVHPSTGIFTLSFGFLTSFFISGSKTMFRTFTGSQYAILSDAVSKLGILSITGLSFSTFLLTSLLTLSKNGLKLINYVPIHILEGMRVGTFLYLLIPEAYTMLRVNEKFRVKEVNLIAMIRSVYQSWDLLIWKELIAGLIISFIVFSLHRKRPKVPWFFFTGIIGAVFGMFQTHIFKKPYFPLLKDNYPMEENYHSMIKIDISALFSSFKIYKNPWSLIFIFGMEMITIVEAALTLKIYASYYNMRAVKKMEYTGISISNFVGSLFGLPPVTLPMGRNTAGFSTGANNRIFNFLNFVFITFFFFILMPFLKYIPTCFMKALNFVNGYILFSWGKYTDFKKFNLFYQGLTIAFSILVLFFDMANCLILSLIITTLYYIGKLNHGSMIIIDKNKEKKDEDKIYEIILAGPFCFRKLESFVEKIDPELKGVEINFSMVFKYEFVYLSNYYEIFEKLKERGVEIEVKGITKNQIKNSVQLRKTEKWILEYIKENQQGGESELSESAL